MICKECNNAINNCEQCSGELESPIVCYHFGECHFCSQECLIDWLFDNGYVMEGDVEE